MQNDLKNAGLSFDFKVSTQTLIIRILLIRNRLFRTH